MGNRKLWSELLMMNLLIVLAILLTGGLFLWRLYCRNGEGALLIEPALQRWDTLYDRWAQWRDRPRGLDGPLGTGRQDRDADPVPATRSVPPALALSPLVPAIPDDVVDPHEAAVIQGTAVPPDWAALIGRVAMFEPEDDAALVDFIRGEAAAFGPYADAWRSAADTLINVIGVDPAAAQGTLELADVLGETAHDVALAQRRFCTVYAQVIEAVSNGLQLPHSGRWLTGGSA
jgi:hypothetical protein